MRPSSPPPAALLAVLLVAVFAVLFADILAVSATADPIPANVGAVLTPISPSSISRPYSHSSFQSQAATTTTFAPTRDYQPINQP